MTFDKEPVEFNEWCENIRLSAPDNDNDNACPISPARANFNLVLNTLPESSPLLAPLLKADEASSDFLVIHRWARALAKHWDVDPYEYARAVTGLGVAKCI